MAPETPEAFHFHDNSAHVCPSHQVCDFCVRPHSEVLKALKPKDYERYKMIRPSLIEHRATVEMELLKAKKQQVPPHIMMDRILRHEPGFQKSLLPATDYVLFNYGPPNKRLNDAYDISMSLQTNSLTEGTSQDQGGKSSDNLAPKKFKKGVDDWYNTPIYRMEC